MNFAVCHLATSAVMSEPTHCSEQVTQLLFGEMVEIEGKKGNWFKIISKWDGYTGWALKAQFTTITEIEYGFATNFMVDIHGGEIKNNDLHFKIPAGSSLPFFGKNKLKIGHEKYKIAKNILPVNTLKFTEENILNIVKSYLKTPYVWGAKTHAGIDCSGFSAMLYRYFNYALKHEALAQAKQGQLVDFLQLAKCGDLAFFENEEAEIKHVGILLNANTIIHATETTGCVTIDDIDPEGIKSRITKLRTHKLRVVKRYIG